MTKLWKVTGTKKNKNPVRMTVRADNYAAARDRAHSIAGDFKVRDIVLLEKKTMTKAKYLEALEALGLSQVKASEFLEVSKNTSPRWSRGDAPVPGAVAKLLRVMVHYRIGPDKVDKLE